MPKEPRKAVARTLALSISVFVVIAIVVYSLSASPDGCQRCHAMRGVQSSWQASAHKDVDCWKCHQAGEFAPVVRPVRILQMSSAWLTGKRLLPRPVVNSRCIDCHQKQLTGVISVRKILVRHSDFIESKACQSCHSIHDNSAKLVLDQCAECHNSRGAGSSCGTCHTGREPSVRKASGWLRQVHTTRQKGHSIGSIKSCALCHPDDFCSYCHKTPLPHGADWPIEHGKGAKKDLSGCLKCHERKGCDNCHQINMPHPNGWLASHPEETAKRGQKLCLECHHERNCLNCHTRHVHPAGFPEAF